MAEQALLTNRTKEIFHQKIILKAKFRAVLALFLRPLIFKKNH